ncbi:unnamed protein product [Penicillium viridicatum]
MWPPLNWPIPPRPPTRPGAPCRRHAPPGMVPPSGPRTLGLAPRASRSRRPASTVHRPVRRSGQLPRRANWRPMPPALGRGAPPAAPSPGTGGPRTACSAWWRGGRGRRGGLPRGPPCQGPHRKIPRRRGTHITQRSYSHPSSIPQPQTVGPKSLLHRLTDPIWGLKVQNAVKVARNCCGGRFLYGDGPSGVGPPRAPRGRYEGAQPATPRLKSPQPAPCGQAPPPRWRCEGGMVRSTRH